VILVNKMKQKVPSRKALWNIPIISCLRDYLLVNMMLKSYMTYNWKKSDRQ